MTDGLHVTREDLVGCGISTPRAEELLRAITQVRNFEPELRWQALTKNVLSPALPPAVHSLLFRSNYADWPAEKGPPPYWLPDENQSCNLSTLLSELRLSNAAEFHRWAHEQRDAFWALMTRQLGVEFRQPFRQVLNENLSEGPENPHWFVGAKLNIVDSCWKGDRRRAAIYECDEQGLRRTWSLDEVMQQSARVARGLQDRGLKPGDAVGMVMPVTAEAVAVYLGVIRAGCAVVCVAESFAPAEIQRRMHVGGAKLVFTCDQLRRHGRNVDVYSRVATAVKLPVVVASSTNDSVGLRTGDCQLQHFLSDPQCADVSMNPNDASTILFSSGTTGDAKAIVWTHTTPIKCASDGFLYQDIRNNDIVAWPTSMGWMMGPWLIYATLMNGAAMALYDEHPGTPGFCRFVDQVGVTVLGVIPSLVAAWKSQDMLADVSWSTIKLFSSTGECSHEGDMLYLVSHAGYRPVIEYCGGTELGGGYVACTLLQPARFGCFTTATAGIQLHIRDEAGGASHRGEAFIEPPGIGLSTRLLNADHHDVYYRDTPPINGHPLRRHGDEVERLPSGDYRVHGRCDDTMNLGGIKVSSAEIERVLNEHPAVRETAAVSMPLRESGPDQLVVFAVLADQSCAHDALVEQLQQRLREHLNPLFKIARLQVESELPRTASNKVMRRQLRKMNVG